MIITNYQIDDIKDFEEFMNNLYIGLQHYKKYNPNFTFKIIWDVDKNSIQLKTMNVPNEQLN